MTTLLDKIKKLSRPMEPIPTDLPIRLHPPIDGIEAVLFDLYGTLLISGSGDVGTAAAVNSAEALTQSLAVSGYEGELDQAGTAGKDLLVTEIARWHTAAKETGIEYPEVEISRVWKKVLEQLQKASLLKPDDDLEKIRRLAVEYEGRVNPVWPMPGALETIRFFRARGLRLGIVSNAQFYTPIIIEALFGKTLAEFGFDEALCVFSYKELRAKPSIELFKKLEDQIDLSKTIYVGNDMLNDIWTAQQAGCRTALFAGDQRSLRLREEEKCCKGLEPDAIIDDLKQITEMV